MTIPDEAVEAAALAIYSEGNTTDDIAWEDFQEEFPHHAKMFRSQARAALTAAAPYIEADALEAAAGDIDLGEYPSDWSRHGNVSINANAEAEVSEWLTHRAATKRESSS